jgi:UDPglucose 6-dehydrogenase
LKSTVLPDIVDRLAQGNPNFIYNPEFLTERNAEHDAEYPIMTVLGGEQQAVFRMIEIYRDFSICKDAPFYTMSPKEASFVKYGVNSFLATKVMFWNQFSEQCEKMGADYDVIKQAIGTDDRISPAHMNVPGHDGRKGTAGACFAKDIPAFIHFSNKEFSILREAWNVNCDIRNAYGEPLPREVAQHITFNKI